MAYAELVRALEEETERQVHDLRDEAARAGKDEIEAARREIARERDLALAALERARADDSRRLAARIRLEQERSTLVEARRLLDQLFAEAAARLAAAPDPDLTVRLVGELLPELAEAGGAIVLEVDEPDAVGRFLAHHVPGNEAMEVVVGASAGARAVIAGRLILDNTLAARLERARPALEPEIARLLFEGSDAIA